MFPQLDTSEITYSTHEWRGVAILTFEVWQFNPAVIMIDDSLWVHIDLFV